MHTKWFFRLNYYNMRTSLQPLKTYVKNHVNGTYTQYKWSIIYETKAADLPVLLLMLSVYYQDRGPVTYWFVMYLKNT